MKILVRTEERENGREGGRKREANEERQRKRKADGWRMPVEGCKRLRRGAEEWRKGSTILFPCFIRNMSPKGGTSFILKKLIVTKKKAKLVLKTTQARL